MSEIYADLPAGASRLRIGLLLDGRAQQQWVVRTIEAIRASGAGEIAAAVFPTGKPTDTAGGMTGDVMARQRLPLPGRLYEWADAAIFSRRTSGPDLLEIVDISPWIAGVPVVEIASPVGRDDEPMGRYRLDMLLMLAPEEFSRGLDSAARFGLWAFGCNGSPGGFDLEDMDAGGPTMEVTLHVLANSPLDRRVIGSRNIAADRRSLYRNRQRMVAGRIELVLHVLRAVQRQGEASLLGAIGNSRHADAAMARRRSRTNFHRVLRVLVRAGASWLHSRWEHRRGEWWFLALRETTQATPPDGSAGEPGNFRPLPCPPGHYHADPFLIEEGGTTHVFFEDFDKARGKGVVAHFALAGDGSPASPETVLERPFHLSYPFLFPWNGETYMLPETGQNRSVELYRCEAFPRSWVPERILLQGWPAKDPTLHQDEAGRWWMFVAIDERGNGAGESLFLFQAESPLGRWRPHPENPIQADPRYARPGGRLFRRGSALLRPAQDGSLHYGSGLWFMEVEELSPERYREKPVQRWGPEWLAGNRCLHHRDATAKWEIIDGMRFSPNARS